MKAALIQTLILIGTISAQEPRESPRPQNKTLLQTASIALGHQEGQRALLKQISPHDIDTSAFLEGFLKGLKGLKGEELEIPTEEILKAMGQLQTRIRAREQETAKANKLAEEQFLAKNSKAKNVIQSENGLQYRIVERGLGEPFGIDGLAAKEILIHYRGTLPDGREFSASNEGVPAKITIDETIPGFRQALEEMPKGAQWVIFIPSALAYRDQRHSNMIGPNQMLIFELTLVDVLTPKE